MRCQSLMLCVWLRAHPAACGRLSATSTAALPAVTNFSSFMLNYQPALLFCLFYNLSPPWRIIAAGLQGRVGRQQHPAEV